MPVLPPKPCVVCGREITWRKKWARNWDHVKYCSDACRRGAKKLAGIGRDLEEAILQLLRQRDPQAAGSKTICPSEAAKAVSSDDWRSLIEPARQAARRLVASGQLEITQGGRVVDPSTAKGPIRLRRRRDR
ncbi:MAG: DUF2256 and DUF3253 domain-containing protein [Planctomycetota bacterium]